MCHVTTLPSIAHVLAAETILVIAAVGSFDLLIHTDLDTQVPKSWEESDPKYISNSAEVKLRSFTTKVCTRPGMPLHWLTPVV